jgi:hypothetical protein
VDLEKMGVARDVIDCMQRTYLDAVRNDARLEEWSHWHCYDDYWYGGLPYGWGRRYYFVPVERERHPRMDRDGHGRDRR